MMSEANSSAEVRLYCIGCPYRSTPTAMAYTDLLACYVEEYDAERTPLTFRFETNEDGQGLQAARHLCSDDAHGR
jgi:hypothetical protein